MDRQPAIPYTERGMRAKFVLVTVIAGVIPAFGQTVTKVPNKIGLDIASVSIDAEAFRAKIVVRNTSGKPITAYAVTLTPAYSDGEEWSEDGLIDFFIGLGMKRVVPQGPGNDPNIDAIVSGAARESTFYWYRKPKTEGAQLTGLRVEVAGVIFDDESTAGDSERFRSAVRVRDEECSEIVRWCPDVKRFSDGPVSRKTVEDMLAAHGPKPDPDQQFCKGAGDCERLDFWALFDYGITWQSDDTATLKPYALDMLDVVCANAKQHLDRRAAQ